MWYPRAPGRNYKILPRRLSADNGHYPPTGRVAIRAVPGQSGHTHSPDIGGALKFPAEIRQRRHLAERKDALYRVKRPRRGGFQQVHRGRRHDCALPRGRPLPSASSRHGGRARKSGSHRTPRRRKQSGANSSLKAKFPASWENTGKFIDSGLRHPNLPSKALVGSEAYSQNSLRKWNREIIVP
jgi:hypothetical protein